MHNKASSNVHHHCPTRRHHAILQHAYDGTLHVYDFHSQYGTRVNGEELPTERFYSLESGDVLTFGEADDSFAVWLEGEDEWSASDGSEDDESQEYKAKPSFPIKKKKGRADSHVGILEAHRT